MSTRKGEELLLFLNVNDQNEATLNKFISVHQHLEVMKTEKQRTRVLLDDEQKGATFKCSFCQRLRVLFAGNKILPKRASKHKTEK